MIFRVHILQCSLIAMRCFHRDCWKRMTFRMVPRAFKNDVHLVSSVLRRWFFDKTGFEVDQVTSVR